MTLLIVRLRADDIQEVRDAFVERGELRASYGCTSARLMLATHDSDVAMALMEFPSYEAAQAYAASLLGNETLPAMSDLTAEFYDDAMSVEDNTDFFTARPFGSVSPIVP